MSLTFVVGTVADVFGGEFARAVAAAMAPRFVPSPGAPLEPYVSEPVGAGGWMMLQRRVMLALGNEAPQLTTIEAYQAAYVPGDGAKVEHLPIPQAADPLQVGSVARLIDELMRFATAVSLPTDDVELMQLAAHYLESDDVDADLEVQTYVQLLLSARQAAARRQPLWVVVT